MISLRQRIKSHKINCVPWKKYRYEIQRLPISSQCLFAKNGISYDILEIELKEEGWLFEDETLFEVLGSVSNLKRRHLSEIKQEDDCPFDDNWTEEDYRNYYESI